MSANEIRDECDERSVESSRRLIEGMCADARVENRAIGARLAKIGELFDVRLAEYGELAPQAPISVVSNRQRRWRHPSTWSRGRHNKHDK